MRGRLGGFTKRAWLLDRKDLEVGLVRSAADWLLSDELPFVYNVRLVMYSSRTNLVQPGKIGY